MNPNILPLFRPSTGWTMETAVVKGPAGPAVLIETADAKRIQVKVTDPLGRPAKAAMAMMGGGDGMVIEMAEASGLRLLTPEERNPLIATTRGTGDLIKAAILRGVRHIVIGIGLMYSMTGTLNMADLSERLPDVFNTRTIPVAFAFLTVGIGLKLALFPLHLWLPNAYAYAPSSVTAFVAATATKVAVYMLLRFVLTVFGAGFAFEVMQVDRILMPLALLAIVLMSISAIHQSNVKKLLAYSSVAQIGYMVLGISLASVFGVAAGILHLFNHALMKGALFMVMGCVMYRVGSVRLEAMAGLGKTMPFTMAAFVLGGLSLIGVPLTVGFVSKWYLVLAALEQGLWPLAVVVLFGSLLAVIYVWKVVEVAYFRPPPDGEGIREAPLSLLVPTWALVLANLFFGIDAKLTAGVALRAAQSLLGVGP